MRKIVVKWSDEKSPKGLGGENMKKVYTSDFILKRGCVYFLLKKYGPI